MSERSTRIAAQSTDDVTQEQAMTEERKREQKPWYPTTERMPEIHNVENWQSRSISDNPVLLEDAEIEENKSIMGDSVVSATIHLTAPIALIKATDSIKTYPQ